MVLDCWNFDQSLTPQRRKKDVLVVGEGSAMGEGIVAVDSEIDHHLVEFGGVL